MTKIENMIDLRLRCVELALDFFKDAKSVTVDDIHSVAQGFSEFILGDSELPKSPISLNDIINNCVENSYDSEKQKEEFDKLLETLANSKQE